ncbi:MAG: hydrogenase formation protein HypD [Melioribacteraceae bacterium]|nr:hydrogenase formation protein HypD [Melioribacteraceae bacterium]
MKFIDEYRDASTIEIISQKIFEVTTHNWNIMEICGGQTHTIMKYNLESLLPHNVNLIHGPGCPVCVTPLQIIDKAIEIASRKDVIFTSYGDMLRVPGSKHDLLSIKANGSDVRIIYSPIDSVKIAEQNPVKQIVFLAIGFETTAPATAMAVRLAKQKELENYSILCAHVLVPPAIELLLSSPQNKVDGVLAAGHVCTVMGMKEYYQISNRYKVPIVITGFEPYDIMKGIYYTVLQLEQNKHEVENQYSRVVTDEGNTHAQKIMRDVFNITDRNWRGIGLIPNSGLKLSESFSQFDAERIFFLENISTVESNMCISGEVLQGISKPIDCPAFGNQCNPEHPLGAPMVSSEGACAAYYQYKFQTANFNRQ